MSFTWFHLYDIINKGMGLWHAWHSVAWAENIMNQDEPGESIYLSGSWNFSASFIHFISLFAWKFTTTNKCIMCIVLGKLLEKIRKQGALCIIVVECSTSDWWISYKWFSQWHFHPAYSTGCSNNGSHPCFVKCTPTHSI